MSKRKQEDLGVEMEGHVLPPKKKKKEAKQSLVSQGTLINTKDKDYDRPAPPHSRKMRKKKTKKTKERAESAVDKFLRRRKKQNERRKSLDMVPRVFPGEKPSPGSKIMTGRAKVNQRGNLPLEPRDQHLKNYPPSLQRIIGPSNIRAGTRTMLVEGTSSADAIEKKQEQRVRKYAEKEEDLQRRQLALERSSLGVPYDPEGVASEEQKKLSSEKATVAYRKSKSLLKKKMELYRQKVQQHKTYEKQFPLESLHFGTPDMTYGHDITTDPATNITTVVVKEKARRNLPKHMHPSYPHPMGSALWRQHRITPGLKTQTITKKYRNYDKELAEQGRRQPAENLISKTVKKHL